MVSESNRAVTQWLPIIFPSYMELLCLKMFLSAMNHGVGMMIRVSLIAKAKKRRGRMLADQENHDQADVPVVKRIKPEVYDRESQGKEVEDDYKDK